MNRDTRASSRIHLAGFLGAENSSDLQSMKDRDGGWRGQSGNPNFFKGDFTKHFWVFYYSIITGSKMKFYLVAKNSHSVVQVMKAKL